MKSLVISIVILIVIIALTVAFLLFSDNITMSIIDLIDEAELCVSLSDRAGASKLISERWDKYSPYFTLGIHASEVKKMDTFVDALDELCNRPHSDTEYYGVCRLLREQALHIKEHSDIVLQNIF